MDTKQKATFRRNRKTILSFDCTSVCHRLAAGNPCAYCYVEAARNSGYRPKRKVEYLPYDNWVLRLKQETVEKLNECGGVRMFSHGDYVAKHRQDVVRFLDDCHLRGLKAKAITKVETFLRHHHNHPALAVCHVSIDSLGKVGGSPISFEKAKTLRKVYPKALVRCVCLSPEDLTYFGKQHWVDIITLNHGQNGFHQFTKAEKAAAALKYGDRLCCSASICSSCNIKCKSTDCLAA